MKWQVQEAKNRFSAFLEKAKAEGPQIVTRHGVDEAVLISIDEYRNLTSARPQLKDFLLAKPFRGLELGRAGHRSRDVEL